MYRCAPIYLDEETLQRLEEVQFLYNLSQSRVIREALKAGLPELENRLQKQKEGETPVKSPARQSD
jgi:hypothetical protein